MPRCSRLSQRDPARRPCGSVHNSLNMGAALNHYPRHIGDYLKKTIGLTMLQDGAYTRALDLYYSEEQQLPPKPLLYLHLRCQGKADREAVDYVLVKYFEETPTGYRHGRCEEELQAQRERTARAAKGAAAKWGQAPPEHEPSIAQASPKHVLASSHKPVTINQESTTKRAAQAHAPPDWLAIEAWERWRKHRGQKLTPQACTLQFKKLSELRDLGHDPVALIDLAIESGWATFYEPRRAPLTRRTQADKRSAVAAAIFPNREKKRDDDAIDGTAERVS